MFHKLLNQVPYLGLKAGPLGGQGSNLGLISFRRPGETLSKAGPHCQTFRIRSHLPKDQKESANKTETIKEKINEGSWTYGSSSLKQES